MGLGFGQFCPMPVISDPRAPPWRYHMPASMGNPQPKLLDEVRQVLHRLHVAYGVAQDINIIDQQSPLTLREVHRKKIRATPNMGTAVVHRRFSQVESAPISRGLGTDQANTTPSVI